MSVNNTPSNDEIAHYIEKNGSVPLSFEDIKKIIEEHSGSIQRKKDLLVTNLNSLIQKMNKDPLLLIDSVYGVRKFDSVKKHIKAENISSYHFVKDKNQHIPYILERKRLHFSPPSRFPTDLYDTDFKWSRDMLNIVWTPDNELTLSDILDLIHLDDNQKSTIMNAYNRGNEYLDNAREICRINCLCRKHTDPCMWKVYASTTGICVKFNKRISSMASNVMYDYKPDEPMDITKRFKHLFSKLPQEDDSKVIADITKLFSLLFGEPFLSPYFKRKKYEWEDECRIIRSEMNFHDDTSDKYGFKTDEYGSYLQFEESDVDIVYLSSYMNKTRLEECINMCNTSHFDYEIFDFDAPEDGDCEKDNSQTVSDTVVQ